eukprot:g7861.t1
MALQTVAAGIRRRSPRLVAQVNSSVAFTTGLGEAPRTPVRKGGRGALAVKTRARSSTPSSQSLRAASSAAGRRGSGAGDVPAKKRPRRVPKPKVVVAAAGKQEAGSLGRTREEKKRGQGFDVVIGVDEAGRGPFAGPVVAAACYVPPDIDVRGIQDSKQVAQHSDREALYKELTESPGVVWATSEVGSRRIDEINILEATKEAMTNCALEVCSKAAKTQSKKSKSAKPKPFVLVDGNFTPPGLAEVDSQCVIGGDGLEYCIAAASIIAKVTRDRLMIEFGERWPVYGFERHKGYGTRAHRDAIREHGMVEIHRRSFLKKMEASGGKLTENNG